MSAADSWMPLHIGRYLSDTMHLTGPEHGAYMLLLMHYWGHGPLPDDDVLLSRIARTGVGIWRKRIGPVVRAFFARGEDGLLHQKRADIERDKATDIMAKRQRAGLARHGITAPDEGGPTTNGAGGAANGSANGQHAGSKSASTRPAHAQQTASTSPANGQHVLQQNASTTHARARATLTPTEEEDSPHPSGGPPRRRESIANDWGPSQHGEAKAASCGITDLAAEVRRFRDHHLAHGSRMADWDAAWRSWCDKAVRFRAPKDHRFSPGRRGALEALGLLDEGDPVDMDRILQ